MRSSLFYRIAAVLLLLFAAGHTLGFRQSDPAWGVDALLASMRSIHFDVQGFNRTLLGPLSSGWILRRRVLSIRSDFGVAAGRPSGSKLGAHARHFVGIRPLLCRHHRRQLEVPLHLTHRILNRDHTLFGCGSMAFSKAGHDRSVAIAGRRFTYRVRTSSALRRMPFSDFAPLRSVHFVYALAKILRPSAKCGFNICPLLEPAETAKPPSACLTSDKRYQPLAGR